MPVYHVFTERKCLYQINVMMHVTSLQQMNPTELHFIDIVITLRPIPFEKNNTILSEII